MNINIIVAYCKNNGIGLNNQLPWNIAEDMKRFVKITKGSGNNAVIMGRNTHESIGHILSGRLNIVLSTTKVFPDLETYKSLEDALDLCRKKHIDEVYIIGGQSVYEEALNKRLVHKIYATEINKEYNCDRFFPVIPEAHVINIESITVDENTHIVFKTFDVACKCSLRSRIKGKLVLPDNK